MKIAKGRATEMPRLEQKLRTVHRLKSSFVHSLYPPQCLVLLRLSSDTDIRILEKVLWQTQTHNLCRWKDERFSFFNTSLELTKWSCQEREPNIFSYPQEQLRNLYIYNLRTVLNEWRSTSMGHALPVVASWSLCSSWEVWLWPESRLHPEMRVCC